ncbi:hypothetical protein PR048_015689 [Dryococelus australis]|uniref:Uncharacterized protein n=1 Tax=Dryococelus australis TaxID=614101 RepID=A0ABQ9HHQ3_9NEOP|nr:hypothetical protein PR048_015689 [Dryococelus australis]
MPLMARDWLDVIIPDWQKKLNIGSDNKIGTIIREAEQEAHEGGISDRKGVTLEWEQNLASKYPKVFGKDGKSSIRKFKVHLVVKEDARPVFHKAYSVPYAIVEIQVLKSPPYHPHSMG